MASNAERFRKWWEKNRALHNLRRRASYAKKKSGFVKEEPKSEATVPGIEIPPQEKQALFTTKKVGEFRMVVLPEEKPITGVLESTDTRSRSDIAMGIWRNDQGGVISKFAYDKLQKLKEHAAKNNFEMDDYSQ